MANRIDFIGRDLATPFNPADTLEQRDWEDWTVPPSSGDLALDLAGATPNSRAVRLLDPSLVPPGGYPLLPDGEGGFFRILPTPDRVAPQRFFSNRGIHDLDGNLAVPGLPGGIPIWTFRNELNGVGSWPAPTIRCVEGEVVHSRMANRNGPHTIHHHGIEPTPMNDGVGHLTFDVNDGFLYDYQWLAAEAGTYFYHCHVNTVLHFEMGMYGMLIIDPPGGPPSVDGGPGRVYLANTIRAYDVEAIWAVDDIDRRWHSNAQPNYRRDAGIVRGEFVRIGDSQNPRLHDFNPDVFVVSGVAAPLAPAGDGALISARGAQLQPGQRLLVRALNASYCTTRWRFPAALQGTVVAVDGRSLGRLPFGRYSSPFTLASIGHRFQLTTAQRWDILIDQASGLGQHVVEVDFHHWYTDVRIFTLRLPITVTAG